MKSTLSRVVLAVLLSASTMGCYSRLCLPSNPAILAGAVLGAGIVSAATPKEPEPEPYYYSNGYFGGPVTPPSVRDRVPADTDLPAFDPQAARASLSGVDVSSCVRVGAPRGFGHAKVTINPDGRISKVIVEEPTGMSAAAAKCVGERLAAATVSPFSGSLVTTGTTYFVE